MNRTDGRRKALIKAKAALRKEEKEERVERKARLDILALRKERRARAARKAKAKIPIPKRKRQEGFKQQKKSVKEFKSITITKKASNLPVDIWATLDNWDTSLFDYLQKRIEGIIKRQHRRGYVRWGIRLHIDKQDVGGEIINADGNIATVFTSLREDLEQMVFFLLVNLHQVGQSAITDYALHFDVFSVVGIKRK